MGITSISLNVHGLRDPNKTNKIIEWLKIYKYDIVFLQETHLVSKSDIQNFQKAWNGQSFFSAGRNHSCGVATLFSEKFPIKSVAISNDLEGRWLNTTLSLPDTKLQLINVYAPNKIGERQQFFNMLHAHIKGGIPTIFGGDLNFIEDCYLDKLGGDSVIDISSVEALQGLTQSLGLTDIYRCKNPSGRVFTWSNGRVSCRLDRFYVSNDIASLTKASDITIFPFSDHDGPFLRFELPKTPKRGAGIWKFNSTLLENPEFTSKMKTFLLHWKERKKDFEGKFNVWWDLAKRKIKHICISFSKQIAKQKRCRRAELELQIRTLTLSGSEEDQQNLSLLKHELETIDITAINGARIRAKEFHYTCNEKSSRYFYQLENKRQTDKVISSLRTDKGELLSEPDKVLDYIANFYSSLYTPEAVDAVVQEELIGSIRLVLGDDLSSSLEHNLTSDECLNALQQMKPDKSPGSDGLPAEFYKFFWDVIGTDIVEVLNFCFDKGLLSDSMRLAIIRLLYKKNSKEDIRNWRPISLLNTDYKIGTKSLANRLKQMLPFLLNPDQTCSVPGRSIFENLFLVRDIFEYSKVKNFPLAIIKIDQEKAFDRVDWSFLERVLIKMKFGPKFRSFIKTIYNSVGCKVLNNGNLSKDIILKRGVRQGCPLSPLLYCIVAETLGNIIRQNRNIKGLHLPGTVKEVKITQYADDTTLFIADEKSVKEAISSIQLFENGSGSKVNYAKGKSHGIWLGPNKFSHLNPVNNLIWEHGEIEVLGINFGSDAATLKSWNKRLEKVNNRLHAWSNRFLSLKGKCMIVNTIALSGLVFISTVFSIPEKILKQANAAAYQFLWSHKNELVNRKSLPQPLEKGGLAILDLNSKSKALHLKFLKYIVDPTYEAPWVFFARYFIGQSLAKYDTNLRFLRSNNVPHSAIRPTYYDNLLSYINGLKDNFSKISSINATVKVIYDLIVSQSYSRPRAEQLWECKIGSRIQWKIAWLNSRLGVSTGHENDVLWKIYHHVLKTASYLKSWGLRINENCDVCAKTEDIEHIFLQCSVSKKAWRYFEKILRKLIGNFELNAQFIFFFQFRNKVNPIARKLAIYLIKLIIAQIWSARCERRFNKLKTLHNKIIYSVIAELKTRIKIVFNANIPLQKQFKMWSYGSILCECVNSALVFNID